MNFTAAFGLWSLNLCEINHPLVYCGSSQPLPIFGDPGALAISLADEMTGILQQQGLATHRLQLGWQRVDNMVRGRDVHFSRPSRDSGAFRRLLTGAAQTIDPEFGLERMWLEAHDCSPQAPVAAPQLQSPGACPNPSACGRDSQSR